MAKRATRGTASKTEKRDYVRIANSYCRDVVAGKIVAGELIIAACQRHLRDWAAAKNEPQFPYVFDSTAAAKVCRFVELLPHIKGDAAKRRETVRLEPWQVWILCTLFGWKQRRDGLRRFLRAYIEVARKNGKSTLAAGVGLYMLCYDDEAGPEVYALATTRDQAGIVWKDAAAMVRKSPGMRQRFGVEAGALAISIESSMGTFQSLPGDPGDGQNPHCAIVDEYHEHKSSRSYDAMYSGMGARSQPMILAITTAGYDLAGPCYQLHEYAASMLRGRTPDDGALFAAIFALDPNDDWTSPSVWEKANPNLGISVTQRSLEVAAQEALSSAAKQQTFKTKRLNLWVSAGNAWANLHDWSNCYDPSLREDDLVGRGLCAVAGLDLASKIDVAARALLVNLPDGRQGCFFRFYMPRDVVEQNAHSTHAHCAEWAASGWITLTPGNVIDYGYIEDDLSQLCTEFTVTAVAFDPWQATQLATRMLSAGAPMVEYRQTVQNLSPPMKEFEARVRSRQLVHDGNPVFTWMLGNVVARVDNKDNVFPRRSRPANKIDGFVALMFAGGMDWCGEQPQRSVYEERGIRSL